MLGTSRWHLELSKNFLPARYAKLPAVHGTLLRSITIFTTPWARVSVMTCLPLRAIAPASGLPTSLTPGGIDGAGPLADALGSMSGRYTQPESDADAEGLAEAPGLAEFLPSSLVA